MPRLTSPIPAPSTGYVVRVIQPTDWAHTYETHVWNTPEEASTAAREIATKLQSIGTEEFEIHVTDQTRGVRVVQFLSRIERKVVYEINT